MSNLLKMVSGLMSDGMVGKVSSLIGSNAGVTKTALSSLMPKILKGIASKGATESGAGSLLSMIKDHGLGKGNMEVSSDLLGKGAKMNDAIFGSSMKDMSIPGVSGEAKSKLMNLATPMVMGSLGKVVNDKNLDAKGLSSYLQKQTEGAAASVTGTATRATSAASSTASTVSTTAQNTTSGGMGFLKWALPLLLLLGAGFFFMNKTDGEAPVESATPTKSAPAKAAQTHTHADGTVHQGASHGSSTTATSTATGTVKDAAGNMMDKAKAAAGDAKEAISMGLSLDNEGNLLKDGKLHMKKGEFTMKDGEYFDKDGKSIGLLKKVGNALGDAGKAVGGAVGSAGKAVGGAVGGAAGKTADFFKNSFGGMFKKKKSGAPVAAYSLNKIQFDDESHMIKSFSKIEVEGLAAALKANSDAKITVQATGGDKATSKARAQVIHDMLVTLGVSEKQIDAKGMGAGDENYSIVIN